MSGSDAGAGSPTLDETRVTTLSREMAARGVEAVALTYVDNSGITRVKSVPTRALLEAATVGVGMSPMLDLFLLDDSVTASETSTGPVGDLRLYPDVGRLVSLAAQPGWAWAPVDRRARTGEAHPLCHRTFAARMVDRAAEAGLSARMGIEIEWVLDAGHGGELVPVASGPAFGMTRLIECSGYLSDLLRAFAAEGLEVEQLHPEYAPSQFEVTVGHNDPVGAADDSVLGRQTIRALGQQRAWRTSFAPVVNAAHVGNGGHLHVSLWRDGKNLFANGDGPYGITAEAEAFMAGVLRELPALLVIGAPSVVSYLRLVPQHMAGAYQAWGLENREAALRLVTGTAGYEPSAANFEVKCFDLSASPYLLVGAVLAAGTAGVAEKLRLPPEVPVDPAALSDDQLESAGAKRLPGNLDEALEQFEASTVLFEALGYSLFETLIAVRRAEQALFAGANPEEVVRHSRWRH